MIFNLLNTNFVVVWECCMMPTEAAPEVTLVWWAVTELVGAAVVKATWTLYCSEFYNQPHGIYCNVVFAQTGMTQCHWIKRVIWFCHCLQLDFNKWRPWHFVFNECQTCLQFTYSFGIRKNKSLNRLATGIFLTHKTVSNKHVRNLQHSSMC